MKTNQQNINQRRRLSLQLRMRGGLCYIRPLWDPSCDEAVHKMFWKMEFSASSEFQLVLEVVVERTQLSFQLGKPLVYKI